MIFSDKKAQTMRQNLTIIEIDASMADVRIILDKYKDEKRLLAGLDIGEIRKRRVPLW